MKIKRDIQYLLTCPKDYLYSFTHSFKKKVEIVPYDSKLNSQANEIKKSIAANFPELKFYLFGSAALKIAGRKELDIFITTQDQIKEKYLNELEKKYGKPSKIRNDYVEWDFILKGVPVELTLSRENSKEFRHQLKVFNFFKSNAQSLKEYENLKRKLNGKTEREYNIERDLFFRKKIYPNL